MTVLFFYKKVRQDEAEQWLDDCFNRILQKYGADDCIIILGGDVARTERNSNSTNTKDNGIPQKLHLSGTIQARQQGDHLKAPLPKNSKVPPRIRFGKHIEGGVWGNSRDSENESPSKEKKVEQTIDLTDTTGSVAGSFTIDGGHKML